MNFSAACGAFLTRHQSLEFSCHGLQGKKDPSKLADNLRNLYLHHRLSGESLEWTSPQSSRRPGKASFSEADEYLKKYADVVDNMDSGGLNNFAEGALALCQFYKNDSSKWETGLTEEKIMQLPCFRDAVRENESGSDSEDYSIALGSRRVPDHDAEGDSLFLDDTFTDDKMSSSGLRNGSLNEASSNSRKLWAGSALAAPSVSPSKPKAGVVPSISMQGPPPQNRHSAPALSLPPQQQVNQQNRPLLNWASSSASPTPVVPHHHQASARLKRSLYQEQQADSAGPTASKVGGPYANFGQRKKNTPGAFGQNVRAKRPSWTKGAHQADEDDDENDVDTEDAAGGSESKPSPFRTARDQLLINQQKKGGGGSVSGANYGAGKKSLGTRRGPASKFVPPVLNRDSDLPHNAMSSHSGKPKPEDEEPVDERLKGIDPKMIELINNEIMDTSSSLTWSDIAGLEFAKKTIQEIVVWPMLRPDIFTGLRGPPKGLLLFGPPGTGKTLIGKCIASQSKSTFFCISASSLTSKWVGEGEKMVRTLFAVARCHQPAVIFIDEIDSLLSQRSDSEHESSRRIKTEFLVQLDGATTESEDRILVIGATNRPQEIDEAARRRFVKRLLIPLPEAVARRQIVVNLMAQQNSHLDEASVQRICDRTDGYSGADMTNLCREAALGPIRSIPFDKMETITPDQVRPIQLCDFEQALLQVRASVSSTDLELYTQWNQTYGSFGI